MKSTRTTLLPAMMLLALTGCGDGDQAATEEQSGSMDAAKTQAQAAAESAAEAGRQAMGAASEAADVAAAKGAELADAATEEAKAMIAKAKDFLAENNLTSAQDLVDKLKALKDSLPEPIKQQIEGLQQQLASMKSNESTGT